MKKGMVGFCGNDCYSLGDARHGRRRPRTRRPRPRRTSPMLFSTRFPISLPRELNLEREKSFVYETPTVKAGVLVLTGNVDDRFAGELLQDQHGEERLALHQQLQVRRHDPELYEGRPGIEHQDVEGRLYDPGRDMGRPGGPGAARASAQHKDNESG